MAETGFGDYFITDVEEGTLDDVDTSASVVVPAAPPVAAPPVAPQPVAQQPAYAAPAPAPQPVPAPAPAPAPVQPVPQAAPAAPVAPPPVAVAPQPAAPDQRERLLAQVLTSFMHSSPDVQASALVSLDGFIIASALPAGMQEDRVGAMSAAILGLGERAAIELGRGSLSQVFIEGTDGYVLLVAAGRRAVMTALAAKDAKLGLVLYDMKQAAARMGDILK